MVITAVLTSLVLLASADQTAAQQRIAIPDVAATMGVVPESESLLARTAGINVDGVTIADALAMLSRVSGVGVAFQPNSPVFMRQVSCNCEELTVARVLDRILVGTGFGYAEVFDQVLITKLRELELPSRTQLAMLPGGPLAARHLVSAPLSLTRDLTRERAPQQQATITGRVVNAATGAPLIGSTVAVQGTSLGGISGNDGRYTISGVPAGEHRLRATHIGYTPAEQTVTVADGQTTTVDFSLTSDAIALQEIVVVGYGTAQRRELTGSVSSVSSRDLVESAGRTRVDEALVGRMPGVQVTFPDGRPGRTPTLHIRGLGSITAGAEPLYVVDGMPTESIETLNMSDVESIDILKDASAAAIYGSRGANGVVLITTRRGQGSPQVTVESSVGIQQVSRIRQQLNARQQAQYNFDGLRNANMDAGNDVSGDPTSWGIPVSMEVMDVLEGRNTRDVNPLDYVLRTAPMQRHSLSVRGAENSVKYAISGEHLMQDGIVINNEYRRTSAQINVDAQVNDGLNFRLNLNPAYIHDNRISDGGHASEPTDLNIIGVATTMHPYFPILASDGHPGGNAEYRTFGDYYLHGGYGSMANLTNPVAVARELREEVTQTRLLGNLTAEQTLTSALKASLMLGATLNSSRATFWRPDLPEVFYAYAGTADGQEQRTSLNHWITEGILSYTQGFGGHNISAVAGFAAEKNTNQSVSIGSDRFPNNHVHTLNAASEITSGSSSVSEWALLSYLSRLSYNWNEKYYLSASVRTDGSSRFGSNNRWGVFPSVGATWMVSEEPFMDNVPLLSDLRVRASYGETGNNNIGNYNHLATVTFESYPSGSGYAPSGVANPDLRWEKQRQTNIGADAGLLGGRLSLTLDWSHSISEDLLLNVQVPRLTGFSSALQNIGKVRNVGWELSVRSQNIVGPAFSWTTDLNASAYRNKVLALGPEGAPIISGSHITAVGRPIGMFWGWVVDPDRPIFLSQAEVDAGPMWNPGSAVQSRPGDYRYVDVNGDGIINNDDRTEMGSPYPDFYYGMTNRLAYKALSLSVTLNGVQGAKILAQSGRSNFNTRGRFNAVAQAWNYWKSEDDIGDGRTPRPNDRPTGGNRDQWNSSLVQDASYLRITNINVGYELPTSVVDRLGVSAARIFYNAINPFIFTDFNGFNPEVSNSSNNLQPGVDLNNYPIAKSHNLGISVSF